MGTLLRLARDSTQCLCSFPLKVFHMWCLSMCSVVLCPVSAIRSPFTGTPSQQKEHKRVLGSSVSLATLGYPWIFLQEKHNLTQLDEEGVVLVSLQSLFIFCDNSVQGQMFFLGSCPYCFTCMQKMIYCGKSCLRLFGEKLQVTAHGGKKTMLVNMEILSSVILGESTNNEVLMQIKFILRFTVG